MYCTKCGNEIKDEAVFCTKCGTPVKQEELNIGEEESTRESSMEILSGPVHNCLCYLGLTALMVVGLVLPIYIMEFDFMNILLSLVFIAAGIAPYIFLVKNMKTLLGRISIFAFILAPIKGIAACFKFVCKFMAFCCFFMPPLAVLLAVIGEAIGDFGYMWIDYNENPKGKVCFK